MTNCPHKLRGDLSKWLCEINTGVYVGNVSSRVRDALWHRVCENLASGQATMVYSANGEQHLDFRVHNAAWEPVDYDGIKLMRRPLAQGPTANAASMRPGYSNAAKRRMAGSSNRQNKTVPECYVVIDIETTGLDPKKDRIIELGAIRVIEGDILDEFEMLVHYKGQLSDAIVSLTGLTDEMLSEQGVEARQALQGFLEFVGRDRIVGHNLSFDMDFLHEACRENGLPFMGNRQEDLLRISRRKVTGVANYKLSTLAEHFGIPYEQKHRALADCHMVHEVYCKLNEIR